MPACESSFAKTAARQALAFDSGFPLCPTAIHIQAIGPPVGKVDQLRLQ